MRQTVFDFRTDGPPPLTCQSCSQNFRDWVVQDEVWKRIRADFQRLILCPACFTRELLIVGVGPQQVKLSYEPWQRRQALWALENTAAPDLAHLRFTWYLGQPVPETMWCRVLRQMNDRWYRVQMQRTSCIDERLRKGTVLNATWDSQEGHPVTGRPVFRPLLPGELLLRGMRR